VQNIFFFLNFWLSKIILDLGFFEQIWIFLKVEITPPYNKGLNTIYYKALNAKALKIRLKVLVLKQLALYVPTYILIL